MTEIDKDKLRRHYSKYSVGYSLIVFLIGVVMVIGLEAHGIV